MAGVKRSPKYREAAYHAIKEAILSGDYPPHQSLIEEQLAEMLAISRTPVREALAILEHEGLIGPRGNRGLYVRSIDREEFIAMFVANETVEPTLAARAARLADEEQLAAIEEAIKQAKACAARGDQAGFLKRSRDFHRLVGEAANNAPLAGFVLRNEERADMYLLSYGKQLDLASMSASLREHENIYRAIAAREPEDATHLMIFHARSLRERLAGLFSRMEGEP
jgi:DNA-binding GntR family transcriptional regulator